MEIRLQYLAVITALDDQLKSIVYHCERLRWTLEKLFNKIVQVVSS